MRPLRFNETHIGTDCSSDEARRLAAMLRDHGYDAAYQLEPPHYWHRYLIDRPVWQHCLLEAVILPPRSVTAGPYPVLPGYPVTHQTTAPPSAPSKYPR